MKMNETKSAYNEVCEGLDILHDTVLNYEGTLMDEVAELAKAKDLQTIQFKISMAEKLKTFINKVEVLKVEWTNINSDNTENIASSVIDDKKGVHERTEWWIADGSIKIETKRFEGAPYSNVVPIVLFKDIAKTAYDFIQRKNFVKTSDVLSLLKNDIISNSDYKKTPRIPVYATFKVLVKENVLKVDDNNSHKYISNITKNDFQNWINSKIK